MNHRVIISETDFKKLIDGTKHTVATDGIRPQLGYIKICVNDGKVIAYSCDGYRGSKVEFRVESDDNFECFIEPFDFKVSKSKCECVELIYDEDYNHTEIRYFGVNRFFKNPGNYPIIEKIFDDARDHDREIGVNENYIAQACKALSLVIPKRSPVVIQTKANNNSAFLIVGGNNDFICEQLILPVRLM